MGFLWEGAPDNMLFGAPSLVGGLLWLWGARYLGADTARAPHLLDTAR